jgi:hypothetical protein
MFHYAFQTTEDGSQTLRLLVDEPTPENMKGSTSEAMHSLRGAFSETNYIYGEALRYALGKGWPLRVLSMGLGLGYVELLASGMAVKGAPQLELEGESFEIVPELRNYFISWLLGTECPKDFSDVYDDILERTASACDVPAAEIKSKLGKSVGNGLWKIREALNSDTDFVGRFSVICFDAFSSKSTPDLWTEEFLNSFFEKACAAEAVLSTYACTGPLKRSLKSQGFTVTIRQGFSSKRDSTFAARDSSEKLG